MSPDHDEPEEEYGEDEAPRSIFSAAWFRVVLVVLVLGVVGAIGIPYVLDAVKAPTTTASTTPSPTPDGAGAKAVTALPEPAKPLAPTPVPSTPAPTAAMPKPAPVSPPAVKSSERTRPEPAKRVERAKASEPARPADQPKAIAAVKPPAARRERAADARPAAPDVKGGGEYFVQVGAFRDEGMAKRTAARLREADYPVTESAKRAGAASPEPPRPAAPRASTSMPGDRYDVLVSGGAAAEINTKLAAKGLASEPAGDGVRIRPSLPLRDAVALSKDLGSEGFKVQVRRGGVGAADSEPSGPAASVRSDAPMLYRVRVGGYPDRAAAQAVLRELREKGYEGFIAKGRD